MTVCRAGAAENEVFPYTYISTLTGKPTDRFVMPVPSFNVISGGSRTVNCLACPEFLIVPTEGGSVAEDMITDAEVYHTLKFGHPEDVRRGACNVGDETGFAPSVQLKRRIFLTESLLSWMRGFTTLRMKKSSHERGVCFVLPDSQECPVQLCAETCCSEKCPTSRRNQACLLVSCET